MESNSFTQQQIDSLFIKYKKEGSRDIRNELFEYYKKIPAMIARRFVGRGIDYDDLVQVASMSLIKAMDRFDLDRGIKFQSFVVPTIIGEIKNYFRDFNQTIKISRRSNEAIKKMKLVINELSLELEKMPTAEQIAKRMGVEEETALELLETLNNINTTSIDSFKNSEDDAEPKEFIGNDEKGYEMVENRQLLKQSLKALDEKEKYVIIERFFHNQSQQVIADKMNVSQMYVSRAEKRALEKMRKAIEN